jgi:sodium/potassium-transporting ATPase subunit alpha
MKVNNASLTGESEDILRIPEKCEKNIFESPNVAFFGTSCTSGKGFGIVFKTGDETVIGQIANLAQTAENGETPIAKELHRFVIIVGSIAVCMGVFFFCINFAFGYGIITNIGFMIGIIVANLPEGLMITITVCMSLAAKKMAANKVLVKQLQSVETLGSTTCICSDKTGTLTQNCMTVSHMLMNGNIIDASINYSHVLANPLLKPEYSIDDPSFMEIVRTLALSTSATLSYTPDSAEIENILVKEFKISQKLLEKIEKIKDSEEKLAMQVEHNLPELIEKAA